MSQASLRIGGAWAEASRIGGRVLDGSRIPGARDAVVGVEGRLLLLVVRLLGEVVWLILDTDEAAVAEVEEVEG